MIVVVTMNVFQQTDKKIESRSI